MNLRRVIILCTMAWFGTLPEPHYVLVCILALTWLVCPDDYRAPKL